MSKWEQGALHKCTHKPLFYYRFLDDIIGAWTHDISLFPQFIHTFNTHHDTIKVKYSIDTTQVHFLDTTVTLEPHPDKIHKTHTTRVYFKPTDTHSLLHKHSYHPKHTFRGIIKSQIIRYHGICAHHTDLHHAINTLLL